MKQRFLLLCTIVLAMVFNVSAQMFSQVSSTLNVGSVYYMTKEANVDSTGVLLDQQVIDDLKGAGYDLTLGYPGEGGVIDANDLNAYDALVVGRNISSGDFKLAEEWAELEVPVVMLSGYIVRSSRLKYLNSSSLKREATNAVDTNKDRVTKAAIADTNDYAFKGVPAIDGKMDYMTWFYDYMAYGIDSFATTNNGKLLASIVDADTAAANGNVLMARWAPGVETYAGSGVTPKSYRSYLQMGADDKSDPKNYNYAQYTDASFGLMINEMTYLATTYSAPTVEISNDATLASIELSAGELNPTFVDTVLMYMVTLAEGTTEVPTVTITTSNAGATVEQIDATTLPGNTIIKVTAEDEVATLTYTINFSVEGAVVGDVVEPGMGTLDMAVMLAADGDTLYLKNGGQYDILASLVIDKKLTIIAEEIPALPALENMPIISNLFTSIQVFDLNTNCDLTIIGVDIDGLGGTHIFNPMMAMDHTINLYVNRCRMHNTTDDILNDDGSNANNITMGNLTVMNSFIYDNGSGHGIYTKHFNTNGSPWIFENVTMWNLGQQFTWIRVMGEGTQEIVFDHMTGYNLSTSEDNKELFGNDEKTADDAAPEADLVIDFKNNIMSTQVSTNEGSLIFKNADGHHKITINNNVLHSLQPVMNQDVLTLADNQEDTDPQFADAANGDFTVGNADLLEAADDGKIIGAVYWHPDFVDDFSDVETGINETRANSDIAKIHVYPNPFADNVRLAIELVEGSEVVLSIFSTNGQLVSSSAYGQLGVGMHELNVNASELTTGVYFYQIVTDKGISTGKIIKN